MNDEFFHISFGEARPHTRNRLKSSRVGMLCGFRSQAEDGFACKHCGYFVSSAVDLAGVLNRNHCPYCLWSRHLDLYRAGDRMNACRGMMHPVGLSRKQTRKKYTSAHPGELMLIHFCSDCAGVSINRLAADDDPEKVLQIFEHSLQLNRQVKTRLALEQIVLLNGMHRTQVERQLFGQSFLDE